MLRGVYNSILVRLIGFMLKHHPQNDCQKVYEIIKPLIPSHSDLFASQEGEDILIRRLIKDDYRKRGFYVDVGAYHPQRFSTTFHFYIKGWRGINIDPLPGTKALFDSLRPRDINLEVGVSDRERVQKYYSFSEPAFNTFSDQYAATVLRTKQYVSLKEVIQVQTLRLDNILRKHLPEETDIDFMNIDVEGSEMGVLRSNCWTTYRPKIVTVESLSDDIIALGENDITRYLTKIDYRLVARTKFTMFFQNSSYDP